MADRDFKKLLDTEEYEFLKTNPRLGKRIMLLGLGGSYAYGTNNENSDIDFRGVTLNLPSDLFQIACGNGILACMSCEAVIRL